MFILPTVKIAFRGLRVNKMRSGLTMLGIIIGVAAVITMLAVGEGARESLAKSIASLGSNLILVIPGSTTSSGARMGTGNINTLVPSDAEALDGESAIDAAAAMVRGAGQVVFQDRNWNTAIIGTTGAYERIRDWPVSEGRFINRQDVDGMTKDCLIGTTVVQEIFGDEDPLGRIIRINQVPFTVVGVLQKKGQSLMGQDQDDVIITPLSTAMSRLFGKTSVNAIMVKGKSDSLMSRAVEQVKTLLRQRHRIPEGGDDDFSVMNLSEMLSAAETQTKIMTILLGAVASVSLLVGGIGIMNIMLVSVTERTREIGIRMAVGARERDILLQFLVEAVVLSLTGGVIGILMGVGFSTAISQLSQFQTSVSLFSVLLSFLFSAAVGIFFGFYPARKAAGMDPISALRYE